MMTQERRPKGIYYFQHRFDGMSHLTHALNSCRSLIKKFDIDFLLGDSNVTLLLDSPYFREIVLPFVNLENPMNTLEKRFQESFKEKVRLRREVLENIDQEYDFFISDTFPFSKWNVKDEIEVLIKRIKAINPRCLITCSLKEGFPIASVEGDRKTLTFFQQYYDYLFVHSDPRIFVLEESFSLAKEINDQTIYTGFINNPDANVSPRARKKRIIVTTGTCQSGEELIYAVLRAAPFSPDYLFVFVLDPKIPKALVAEIKLLAKKVGAENIEFVSFTANFHEYLCESALSISLGVETALDVVYTNTPSIVLPSNSYEQHARAMKFAAFGYMKLISLEDLTTDRLSHLIQETLIVPKTPLKLDMGGSQTTCEEIERLLEVSYKFTHK